MLGQDVERQELVRRFGLIELLQGMLEVAAKLGIFGGNLRQHGFERGPGGRIVIQLQAQRAVAGVELQAIQQHGQYPRIVHAQPGQQKGDIGPLLFAQFFVECEQRRDGALGERQQRLHQLVGHVLVRAPYSLDQEIEGLRTLPVTEQIHQ